MIDVHLRQKNYEKTKMLYCKYENKRNESFQEELGMGAEIYYYLKGQYYEAIYQNDSAEYYYRKLTQKFVQILIKKRLHIKD